MKDKVTCENRATHSDNKKDEQSDTDDKQSKTERDAVGQMARKSEQFFWIFCIFEGKRKSDRLSYLP